MNLTLEWECGHNDAKQRHLIEFLLVIKYCAGSITR